MSAQLTPPMTPEASLGARPPSSDVLAINPILGRLAMVVTQDLALSLFFRQLTVLGAEHLPLEGPVLLAPTHRSRWDALLLPHAAGRRRTGRDCRFMVSIDEMVGLQGWFLQRLGCFPVNPRRPGPSSLRLAVEMLQGHQQLVVFPEGRIQQDDEPLRLMPGLARLAQLALAQGVPVQVLPVGIGYGHSRPRPWDKAAICFGAPQPLEGDGRRALASFTYKLAAAMQSAEEAARRAVGRPRGAA
jgi:1-acyl-sn-glycerol-3-phosphate acyltransferase